MIGKVYILGKVRLLIIVGFTLLLSSCLVMEVKSSTSQITREKQKCSVDQSRASKYKSQYASYFSGSYVDQAFNSLSNVPEQYLEWVFRTHSVRVSITGNGTYNGGVTQLDINQNTKQRIPYSIQSEIWSLPHEFGHASFGRVQEMHSGFYSELKVISDLIWTKYQNASSQYLNQYNPNGTNTLGFQTNPDVRLDETLAELFDTWYCSETARNLLKQNMPEVYDFAWKYLLPPLDGSDSQGGNGSIKLFVKNEGSLSRVFIAGSQSELSYCVGSKDYCQDSSNRTTLSKIKISSKLEGFKIENINLSSITSNNPLNIYSGKDSDDTLLRSVRFSRK